MFDQQNMTDGWCRAPEKVTSQRVLGRVWLVVGLAQSSSQPLLMCRDSDHWQTKSAALALGTDSAAALLYAQVYWPVVW